MNVTSHRHLVSRALLPASALLAGTLLAACSDDSPAASSSSSGDSQFAQALEYAQCMRDNGVENFPDPVEENGGIRITPGDAEDPDFPDAEEACRELSPQQRGEDSGTTLDAEKVATWAQCIRDNGVPGFPDPEIDGGTMRIPMNGEYDPQDPAFQEAMDACQDQYPGGGVMFGGGPQ